MTVLTDLAEDLETTERTLRRLVSTGFIRAHRPSPRRVEITLAERHYLRSHWPLVRGLLRALRTEPQVRTAILFGSVARGSDDPASDIDIAVVLRDDTSRQAIARRVGIAVGRDVQLVDLRSADKDRSFSAELKRDGRVLIDRDGNATTWVGEPTR